MNESSWSYTQKLDIYRETCLRYLGYFGLLGNLWSIIPGNIAKTVAISYIISDVADKSYKSIEKGEGKRNMVINASDAIIWQTASTILIPGFLIKSFSEYAQKRKVDRRLATFRSGALPFILGLALMPFLSYPIDSSVSYLMDNSYRKWFKVNAKIPEYAYEPTLYTSQQGKPKPSYESEDFEKIYKEMKSRTPPSSNKSENSTPDKSSKKSSRKCRRNCLKK